MWIMVKDRIIEQLVICDNLATKSLSNPKRRIILQVIFTQNLNDPKTL
jgi:hypothetical protein